VVEAALLAADEPLATERLQSLFDPQDRPSSQAVRETLSDLANECSGRGIELREVASGFRFQVRAEVAPWVCRLWEQRPARHSRALLETLAIIAYRQPVSRGEIEDIRGVTVSTAIIKTLLEQEWIRVLGHREAPGRPALYGTARRFLDHFGLKGLAELPPLADIAGQETERDPQAREPAPEAE
jgi:segregation and condensation protein B